jgi:probable phosphoglycerate mutase
VKEKGHMEPAIRLLLVRHGETEWNRLRRFQGRTDLPLNDRGRDQAMSLALALKEEPIAAIYTSSLLRAVETARIIQTYHPAIPLYQDEGLMEMDLGDFEGMEAQVWAECFPDLRKVWQEDPSQVMMPGGESLSQVQTRAMDALQRITGRHRFGCTLLICGHNFVNLTILCHAMDLPLAKLREVPQGTAALNELYKQGLRLRVERLNERSHLSKHT